MKHKAILSMLVAVMLADALVSVEPAASVVTVSGSLMGDTFPPKSWARAVKTAENRAYKNAKPACAGYSSAVASCRRWADAGGADAGGGLMPAVPHAGGADACG